MKKNILKNTFLRATTALTMSVALLTSCAKSDPAVAPLTNDMKTITTIVSESPNFSFLKAAVLKAGIETTLNTSPATLTVFAPTNDAFKAAGFATEAAVTAADVPTLQAILKNHILSTNRQAASFVNGEIITNNLNLQPLVVSKNGAVVTINSSVVTSADLIAKNGVIHTVSSVILPRTSILAAALATPSLSLLATAVANVSLNTTTNVAALLIRPTTQKLTVFAPNDVAFTAAGLNSAFLSNPANAPAILSILTYHVLGTEVRAAQVPAGPNAPVDTFDGIRKLFVTRNASGVFINGIPVATADVAADNGVVHVLGSVLIPASTTITGLVASDPRFSRLLAVIQYVDANTTPSAGLATLLSGTANPPFTVFAPVNAAFNFVDANNDGTIQTSELAAVGAVALGDIVRRHVAVNTRAFSSDLSNGQVITMANGTVTVAISGAGVVLTANTIIPVPSTVAVTNVLATNGVVHAVSGVIR